MSEKPTEITLQNVLTVDIGTVAWSRFNELNFEKVKDKLGKIQKWLVEAEDLNYEKLLIPEDISHISDLRNELIKFLQNLILFDNRTTSENAKQEHDALEVQIESYYHGVYQHIAMRILPFFREERRREKPEEKKTDEEIRKITQIRKELEEELKKVQEETKKVRVTSKEVGTAKGERASVRLATHFAGEAGNYQNTAGLWLKIAVSGYIVLLIVLMVFGIKTVQYLNDILSGLPKNLIGGLSLVLVWQNWFSLLLYGTDFHFWLRITGLILI